VRFSVGPIEPVGAQLKAISRAGPVNLAAAFRRHARDLPNPRATLGISSGETDITTERRNPSSECAGADVDAAVARRLGRAGR
jgi:hypothetical protein